MKALVLIGAILVHGLALATPLRISERLRWLPADVTAVSFGSPDRAPLFGWLGTSMKERTPACYAKLVASLDAQVMLQRYGLPAATNVFHGHLDRDALESCASEVFLAANNMRISSARTGAITEFRQGGSKTYVGWTREWAILDDDRARVETLLAAVSGKTARPELLALAHRAEPCEAMCSVGIADYTSRPLGAPSHGYALFPDALEPGPKRPKVRLTIMFDSPAGAKLAATNIKRYFADPKLSPALREILTQITPVQREGDLTFDVAPVFLADTSVLREATERIQALVPVTPAAH